MPSKGFWYSVMQQVRKSLEINMHLQDVGSRGDPKVIYYVGSEVCWHNFNFTHYCYTFTYEYKHVEIFKNVQQ